MTEPKDDVGDGGSEQGRDGVHREVVEEDQEVIHVLTQEGLSLEERIAQEAEFLDEGDEVELSEKGWHKRSSEDLDAIHDAVDAMEEPSGPRGPYQDVVDDAAPGHDPEPKEPEPKPEPEAEAAAPKDPTANLEPLSEEQEEALAEHVPGEMLTASPIYRTRRGQVVEVTYQATGRVERTLLTLVGEEVRDLNSVAQRVDALRTTARVEPAPEPEAAEATPEAEEDEAPEAEDGRGGLGARMKGLFGRGDDEDTDEAPDDEETPSDGPDAEEAAEATPDEEDEEGSGGLGARMKGLFGRGDDDDDDEDLEAPDTEDTDPDDPADDEARDPDEEDAEPEEGGMGKRLKGLFRRGKDEDDEDEDPAD